MSIKRMSVYIDDCTTRKEVVLKIRGLLDRISDEHKNVEFCKIRMDENVAYRLGYPNTLSIYNVPICIDPGISIHIIIVEYREYFTTFLVDQAKVFPTWEELDYMQRSCKALPEIKNVIYNDPATIIFWGDGTKTIVKCQEGDIYDSEKGLAIAIAKKALGNKGNFNDVFKKWACKDKCDSSEINVNFIQKIVDNFNQSVFKAWNELPVDKLLEGNVDDKD